MGSPHKDRSQEKLHELFRGFPDLVQAYLSAALRDKLAASKSDAPLRVLDIGAGTVPYRAAFSDIPHEKLDIYLWDRDSTVHDSSLRAAWLKNDFFDVFPPNNSRIVSTETRDVLRKKFDVILLAASLHELHYDAVVNWGVLGDFHKIFFNYLTKDLLADGGRILIADYGWPKSARADHVWRIRDVQEELTGHADPPWTFLPLTRLQELARDAGLMVLNTSARGLYDQLSKRDLEEKFSGRLTPEQQETLQLRLGFVVSFEQSITRGETSSQSFGSNPLLHRRAVAMVSKKAEVIFQAAPANEQRMAELGRLFTQPYSVLNDRAALWHFVGEMRRLAEQELNEQQVPTPGVFEAWLSVGLSRNSMSKAKQTRFIPRLDLPWNEKHNPCPAGVKRVCFAFDMEFRLN